MSSASLEGLASDKEHMTPNKAASNSSLSKKGIKIPWVGKLRHPSRLCLQEWIFLLGAACMYLITLGFTLQRIIVVDKNTEDFTFALMLIIHIGFCCYHVVFGLFSHRPYELMAHLAGLTVIDLDCILNLVLTNDSFDDPNEQMIKVVRLTLICFGTVLQFVTGTRILGTWLGIFKPGCAGINLAKLVNWLIHKLSCSKPVYAFPGVPEVLRRRFNRQEFCCTLLTVDLQYEVILIVLVLEDGISDLGIGNQLLVFCLLTPYALLYFIVGHVTFRLKISLLVAIFLAISWPLPVFIVKVLYDVATDWHKEKDHMLEIITIFLAFVGLVMRVTVFLGVGWPSLIRLKRWKRDTISPTPQHLEPFDKLDTDVTTLATKDTPATNHNRNDSSDSRVSDSFLELQAMYPRGESTTDSPDSCTSEYSSNFYI